MKQLKQQKYQDLWEQVGMKQIKLSQAESK